MRLASILAIAVLAPPAAATEPRVFETRDPPAGQVDGGGLITYDGRGFKRFDLATGTWGYVYRRPRRTRFDVRGWDAAAGRIGADLGGDGRHSGALIIDTNTGATTRIPVGRVYDRRNCGRSVKLEGASPAGEFLITEAKVPCGRKLGRLTVKAYGPDGTRTLVSRPTRHPFLSSYLPYRSLVGDHYLTQGQRVVKVRNLRTGAVRRLLALGHPTALSDAALGPDGRVLVSEFRGSGRPLRQIVRLVGPDEHGRAGRLVYESARRTFVYARFCGRHPVLYTLGYHGRYRLILPDPGTVLSTGVLPEPDYVHVSCDARTLVATSGNGATGRIHVHDLPG